MVIEFGADFHQNFLSQDGLHNIDGVLGGTGKDHCPNVQAAVEIEKLQVFEMDGLVDDPLLHLQGKDPEEEAGQDDQQQKELQQSVTPEDPVEQGALGNKDFLLSITTHRKPVLR